MASRDDSTMTELPDMNYCLIATALGRSADLFIDYSQTVEEGQLRWLNSLKTLSELNITDANERRLANYHLTTLWQVLRVRSEDVGAKEDPFYCPAEANCSGTGKTYRECIMANHQQFKPTNKVEAGTQVEINDITTLAERLAYVDLGPREVEQPNPDWRWIKTPMRCSDGCSCTCIITASRNWAMGHCYRCDATFYRSKADNWSYSCLPGGKSWEDILEPDELVKWRGPDTSVTSTVVVGGGELAYEPPPVDWAAPDEIIPPPEEYSDDDWPPPPPWQPVEAPSANSNDRSPSPVEPGPDTTRPETPTPDALSAIRYLYVGPSKSHDIRVPKWYQEVLAQRPTKTPTQPVEHLPIWYQWQVNPPYRWPHKPSRPDTERIFGLWAPVMFTHFPRYQRSESLESLHLSDLYTPAVRRNQQSMHQLRAGRANGMLKLLKAAWTRVTAKSRARGRNQPLETVNLDPTATSVKQVRTCILEIPDDPIWPGLISTVRVELKGTPHTSARNCAIAAHAKRYILKSNAEIERKKDQLTTTSTGVMRLIVDPKTSLDRIDGLWDSYNKACKELEELPPVVPDSELDRLVTTVMLHMQFPTPGDRAVRQALHDRATHRAVMKESRFHSRGEIGATYGVDWRAKFVPLLPTRRVLTLDSVKE